MVAVDTDVKQIAKSAERMVASEPATIGAASVGDVVRQGDLYLVCLADAPIGKLVADRQLAPGTTQGSRHVAEGDCELREAADKDSLANRLGVPVQLVGPALLCKGATTITHPEHGYRTLPADSVWAVVYQRQYAEEVRRIQD